MSITNGVHNHRRYGLKAVRRLAAPVIGEAETLVSGATSKVDVRAEQVRIEEVHSRLVAVKTKWAANPGEAYLDLLILADEVKQSPVETDVFPSLDWRDFCAKTKTAIPQLKKWCEKRLDPELRKSAIETLEDMHQASAKAAKRGGDLGKAVIRTKPKRRTVKKIVKFVIGSLNL